MEVAHIDAFRRDPAKFWASTGRASRCSATSEPNDAHRALAELERRDLLEAVITQNIDQLHHQAGSQRVIEVHGSIRTSSCQWCGTTFPLDEVDGLFGEDGAARCSDCSGPVKPDVVLFGELLPADAMAAGGVAGSRGRPDALRRLLPRGLSGRRAAVGHTRPRGRIAVITKGPTPFDGDAAVRMDGDVVADLDAVLAAL
mgnify:CR=1 FL=1